MAKHLSTEQQVKDALMVDSFQNLSQEQIRKFVRMMPNIDKDVAIAIMSQFPAYTESASTVLTQLNVLCDRTMKSNDSSQIESINAYKKVLDDLSERLQKENLTFAEKQEITRDMIEIADRISKKDTENKIFLGKILAGVAIGACAVGAIVIGCMMASGSKGGNTGGSGADPDDPDDDLGGGWDDIPCVDSEWID